MRDWTATRIHLDALTVICPHCKAPPNAACRNPITGQPLQAFPAHTTRIRAANPTQDTPNAV
jgi:hypothetical protein